MATVTFGAIRKCKMLMTGVTGSSVYDGYLSDPKNTKNSVPILGKHGEDVGSLGDSSVHFDSVGATIFKTEVATNALVNANGKFCIDYNTGAFHGQAAQNGYAKVFWTTKIVSNV